MPTSFRTWGLVIGALVAVVVLGPVAYLLVFRPTVRPPPTSPEGHTTVEDGFQLARDTLSHATDLGTCRVVLQQLNVDQPVQPEHRPEPLTADARRLLQEQYGLAADDLDEVEHAGFTLLDGRHLEMCFLLHDTAHALDVEGLPQAEQAAAAFAWVVRQVRLAPELPDAPAPVLPPQFVLRRGWGSARERALVFAALLRQFGIDACVLASPDSTLWACGALVNLSDDKGKSAKTQEVILFDPRLGMPIPGGPVAADTDLARALRRAMPLPVPAGREIATLSALRRQPDLLKQLAVDDKHPYDVAPAQVQGSQVLLVGMLSALAPRMKYLEDGLGPAVPVHLARDPVQLQAAWTAAAERLGPNPPAVKVWKEATRGQRWFWPAEEGGADRTGKEFRGRVLSLVEPYWAVLPARFNNGDLGPETERRLKGYFAQAFIAHLLLDPQHPGEHGLPRDAVLRGHYDEAAPELVTTRDRIREQHDRLTAADGAELRDRINGWCDAIVAAEGERRALENNRRAAPGAVEQARAREETVWKEGQEMLTTVLDGLAASIRGPEVTYLLALCKQEQAERLQARLERLRRGGKATDDDAQAALGAWKDALSWWEQHASEQPPPSEATAARLLRARALQALGQRDEARRLLEDLSGNLTNLEQTARLYLARQLRQP